MSDGNQLTAALQDAIQSSGMSRYQIAALTGISQGVLSRFVSGQRDLQLTTAGKLAAALGLELRSRKRQRAAAPAQPPDPDIVQIMRWLDSGADRGALITFRKLRKPAGLSKQQFDELLLRLSRQRKLVLHRHDFPHSLDAAERDQLVHDGDDSYFVGATLRMK